jgi:hypothetical protein
MHADVLQAMCNLTAVQPVTAAVSATVSPAVLVSSELTIPEATLVALVSFGCSSGTWVRRRPTRVCIMLGLYARPPPLPRPHRHPSKMCCTCHGLATYAPCHHHLPPSHSFSLSPCFAWWLVFPLPSPCNPTAVQQHPLLRPLFALVMYNVSCHRSLIAQVASAGCARAVLSIASPGQGVFLTESAWWGPAACPGWLASVPCGVHAASMLWSEDVAL